MIPLIDTSEIKTIIMRAIKIKEDVYYGPKNANKNKFMRLYKKLGLSWRTEKIDGIPVDGWFNRDKSQYIIKLPQDGDFKRLLFHGCDEIFDYFMSLGAIVFDYNKEDITNYKDNTTNNIDEGHRFIGADLWSRHRVDQLLKDAPMNWGVRWK